jgi:hypothetical protein
LPSKQLACSRQDTLLNVVVVFGSSSRHRSLSFSSPTFTRGGMKNPDIFGYAPRPPGATAFGLDAAIYAEKLFDRPVGLY